MLTDKIVLDQIRQLDHEVGSRLRGTAAESLQWAEKLFDCLSEAQETHRQTMEGVAQHIAQIGSSELEWEFRAYLAERQKKFSTILRDAYLAIQIQDVTMQAIERACATIERREAHLGAEAASESFILAEALRKMLVEYVESDDQHRGPSAEAA